MSLLQRLCVLAVALLLAAGCIEKKEKVTLNPDGTGKADLDLVMMLPPAMGDQAPDPKQQAQALVSALITQSKSVDAWKDVKYEVLQDGRVHISGTAYFNNIQELNFANAGKMNLSWTKQEDGSMLLAVKTDDAPAPEAPKMTEEEIVQKAAQVKAQYNQSKPMMTMALGSFLMDTTYLLPGKTSEVQVLKAVDGGVQLKIEGKDVIASLDKMMADEATIAKSLRAGRQPGQGATEEEMNESLFGTKGKLTAKVTDLKPQFDYAAEMAAAKAGEADMVKGLNLTPVEVPAAPAPVAPAPAQ